MQTDLGKKIYSIIKSNHSSFDQSVVQSEISLMEEYDVCGDMLGIYKRVSQTGSVGVENNLNSYVAFLLGITSSKPQGQFKLEKRRTYGRASFPDIDMDFNHYRRHEVAEYLIDKYGRDKVSNIGTIQRLTIKNCLHKTIAVLDPEHSITFDADGEKKEEKGANFALRINIANTLPRVMKNAEGKLITKLKDAYNEYPEFRHMMDRYPEVYRVALRMEGGISAFGCLSKDTLVEIENGWARIDEVDNSCKLVYLDSKREKKYTRDFVAHCTGKKKLYKMTLDNGEYIKVTDEHLIFTNKGIVAFEKIRKNPKNYKVLSTK